MEAKKTSQNRMSIKKLRGLLELAAEFKVSELEIDGMRVVIDVPAQMMTSKKITDTVVDNDTKINEVKQTLESLLQDQAADEAWST